MVEDGAHPPRLRTHSLDQHVWPRPGPGAPAARAAGNCAGAPGAARALAGGAQRLPLHRFAPQADTFHCGGVWCGGHPTLAHSAGPWDTASAPQRGLGLPRPVREGGPA